jgi:hypothetical protein
MGMMLTWRDGYPIEELSNSAPSQQLCHEQQHSAARTDDPAINRSVGLGSARSQPELALEEMQRNAPDEPDAGAEHEPVTPESPA